MAGELTTTNYSWIKPTVGSSTDAWGGFLNTDLDGIDSTVKSVSNVANAALPFTGSVMTGLNENRIINGDMRIDQRWNGASGTANGYTVDRWSYSGSQASKITWGKAAAPPGTGFPNCIGFTSSSAYASLAGDVFQFFQNIEADMVSDFAWGTANAQPVTLSFWAQSSLAGTFSGAVVNWTGSATNRSYPFSFSIPAANVMTKIVIAIAGDVAGTWVMSGNAIGVVLRFDLGSGVNFRAAAGAWIAGNMVGVTGAVSLVGTNAATLFVTGVKLEIGSVATPYPRQSLAKSLADCQRYYQQPMGVFISTSNVGVGASYFNSFIIPTMRATPTWTLITYSGLANSSNLVGNGTGVNSFYLGATAGAAGAASGYISSSLSAEL